MPASALAAPRFASPADLGTGDCLSEADSCDLPTAVSGAGAGDDISVRGDMGDYALSAQLTNPNGIHILGTHGRPRLIFTSERLTLKSGSSAENLYVEVGGTFGDVQLTGSTGNNLIVKNTGHDHAIFMENSTLTNSVAWSPIATGNGEQPIELDQSNTLRNVTAYAPTDGAIAIVAIGRNPPSAGPDVDNFVNVIARGGSGGAGIRLFQDNGVDLTANVDHSNYSSAEIDPDSDDMTKVHLNLDPSNQTDAPLFADATGGNFHQVAGSPTIDSGVNNAANGTADFDGDARTLNSTTDIGADEAPPGTVTPPAVHATATDVSCSYSPVANIGFRPGPFGGCDVKVTDIGVAPARTPTGVVRLFPATGGLTATSCTLSGGKCSVGYTLNSPLGKDTIQATYAGDSSHTGSSGSTTLLIPPVVPGMWHAFVDFKMIPKIMYAAGSGPATAKRRKVGARVSYTLNAPAVVRFTVQRRARGRRVVVRKGGKRRASCRRETRRNRHKKACARFVKVRGSFTLTGKTGANSFRFRGRIGGKRLKPGRYRLVATPSLGPVIGARATKAFRVRR